MTFQVGYVKGVISRKRSLVDSSRRQYTSRADRFLRVVPTGVQNLVEHLLCVLCSGHVYFGLDSSNTCQLAVAAWVVSTQVSSENDVRVECELVVDLNKASPVEPKVRHFIVRVTSEEL